MNNERKWVIQILIFAVGIVFSIRLFYIQIIDPTYKLAAQNNILKKEIEYPYRGTIKDRKGIVLVADIPSFDLLVTPREVQPFDTLLFCDLLKITKPFLIEKITQAKAFSPIKPSIFKSQLSKEEFASLQAYIIDFKGFSISVRSVREYPTANMSHVLGYIGEISKSQLEKQKNYYVSGDYIGISGVEQKYEKELRGKKGVTFNIVNVKGINQGAFKNGELDTASTPGLDIKLSMDNELQKYAEKLMVGKVGSIVAVEPETGEILVMVSSPSYDPNLLSGRNFSTNYQLLTTDSLKPLFNRPIMALYPPGSMFKTVQALIALQMNRIGIEEKIVCDGSLIGDHAPSGIYDVKRAIQLSSNNFFVKVFRRVIDQNASSNPFMDSRIGLENWRKYTSAFGLGSTLGVDIPNELKGFVPSVEYFDKVYGNNRWKFSNFLSMSIGQGELLVTPIQMANLGAIIANRGYYITPHVVSKINGNANENFVTKNYVGIDTLYFKPVIDGMELVVSQGTGTRAFIPDIAVCGKTSTVQNPHGEDHSGFMGFAPKNKPKIAIAVYVENAGQGARAAATIAGLIIEKYINGNIKRQWLEDYVLAGKFGDKQK